MLTLQQDERFPGDAVANAGSLSSLEDTDYPEFLLNGRVKLAYDWIDPGAQTLLDGGCAHGYAVRFFREKCSVCLGLDPDGKAVAVARRRYPDIRFQAIGLEQLQIVDETFDVVIINDVLEHVNDEIIALNTIYHALKTNGSLIITVPHRGLFGFLDPGNYVYLLKSRLPLVYRVLYTVFKRKRPSTISPGCPHRHYSLRQLHSLLDQTDFQGRYLVEKVFRSGLLMGVLEENAMVMLQLFMKRKWALKLAMPLRLLARLDYGLPFGPLSYNLAIKIRKK